MNVPVRVLLPDLEVIAVCGTAGNSVVPALLESGLGVGIQKAIESGLEFTGRPGAGFFNRPVGRLAVHHDVPIVFLAVYTRHFGCDGIQDLPLRRRDPAEISGRDLLNEKIGESVGQAIGRIAGPADDIFLTPVWPRNGFRAFGRRRSFLNRLRGLRRFRSRERGAIPVAVVACVRLGSCGRLLRDLLRPGRMGVRLNGNLSRIVVERFFGASAFRIRRFAGQDHAQRSLRIVTIYFHGELVARLQQGIANLLTFLVAKLCFRQRPKLENLLLRTLQIEVLLTQLAQRSVDCAKSNPRDGALGAIFALPAGKLRHGKADPSWQPDSARRVLALRIRTRGILPRGILPCRILPSRVGRGRIGSLSAACGGCQ